MWRPHGHARADPQSPRAWGVCDRCNFLYNLQEDLLWQYEWRGTQLGNTHLRVCRRCLDKPFIFFRAVILPPDPEPVPDPRPENLLAEEGPTPAVWSPRQAVEYPLPPDGGVFILDESDLDGPDLLA